MTKKELIEHWADDIIPVVFRAEEALRKAEPEWDDRLRNFTPEEAPIVAKEYCHRIAEVIIEFCTKRGN